jgi:hypothetical protein
MNWNSSKYKLLFFFFQLCSLVGISQQDMPGVISEKYEDYQKKLLPEKLYVHTDKDFYLTGQLVWFKIYPIDGFYNKPLPLSKIAYVEILDQGNTPVLKAKVELKEKGGDGSFQLPLTFNSGYYTFRAYTNWMKNIGPSQFFEKRITIVNTLKALPAFSEKVTPLYTLDLFPEGGNLVAGFPSKVGFALKNRNGDGVDGKGYLLDENNDTVSMFSPFKFGLGSFDFTPSAIHSYKVVFVLPGLQAVAKPLPKASTKGYTMSVEDEADNKVKVTVRTNVTTANNSIVLLVTTHHQVRQALSSTTPDGVANFILNKDKLPGGISTFTVFNNQRQPVAERLFFSSPLEENIASINADRAVYGERERVSFLVNPVTEDRSISLAVYRVDSLQLTPQSNIKTWLYLESELNEPVQDPQYYFSGNSPEVKKAADNLMLTAGWRRFDWEKAFSNYPLIQFPLESSGHIITAKVTDIRTNDPAKEIPVYLSVPQTRYKLYTNEPNAQGLVKFEVKDFYGPGELILQTNLERDTTYRIEVINPFSETYITHTYPAFVLSGSKKGLLESYSVGMQAQHIYYPESVQRFNAPVITDTFQYFGKALNGYNLDDYVRFTTMEEVLREYVREINVGIRGGGDLKFKLLNTEQKRNLTQNLLVTVDGVPIFNPDVVFKYDPLKFKRIDVNSKGFVLGTSYFNGMASFLTYPETFEGIELDPRAVAVDYEGLQLQRIFYSPDYSSPARRSSRIPDLRTTLLWAPEVSSGSLQFYTGDNRGKYIAVLEGLTKEGKPLTATAQFEVQ